METLHIRLLADFRLVQGHESIETVNTPRLQSLLAYLLLHRHAPQSRHHLAFQFWPESSEKQAHTNLRKLLFQLRNALPDPDYFLNQDHLNVQWRPEAAFILDVAELEQALERCVSTNGKLCAHPQHAELAQVVNLYQGELLPSCMDEWILPVRQRLQHSVMQVLEQLIELSQHQQEYRAGINYARHLLGLAPLHERAHQQLMQLYALNGERLAALHHYHTCSSLFKQELGVEPDEETHTLYQRILNLDLQAPESAAKPFDTPLIGRSNEWHTLLTTWRQVQRHQAHFLSIVGEAGIGKTRLAEELMVWASAQGMRTARTRSYEAEGGLAYGPVTEWLRTPPIKDGLKKLDKVWLSEVARLLPELLSEHANLTPPAPLSEGWQRQRFFEALARAILIDKSPLLLLIDDLQWCDSETLAWLRFLLRFDPQARLLILGTWRSESMTTAHPMPTLLRDLGNANQLTTLELTALSAGETAELAQQLATRQISAPEMQELYRLTEGHPLFVVETVQARGEEGVQSLPPKVQHVIQTRLAQLSDSARELAGLAATIGRSFTLAVLTHASQQTEETFVRALDELWQRRIVREVSAGDYDLSHDRIREVAYQSLSAVRRRMLHRRVAEALEVVHADQIDEISGELAAHYEQAGLKLKARSYWQRSGKRAAAQFANQEALQHLNKALTLTASDEQTLRFELLVQREAIYAIQGHAKERFADLLTLQQISQQLLANDSSKTTPAVQSALLLGKYYQRAGHPEQTVISLQTAAVLARQAGEGTLEAQAWFHLGDALFHQGKLAGSCEALHQAIACAKQAQLTDIEASANEFLAATCMFSGAKAQEIATYLQRALALFRQRNDLIGIGRVFNKLGYLPIAQGEGDYTQAKRDYDQSLEIARQIGNRPGESNVWRNLGVLYTCTGDYQQALAALANALTLDRQQRDLHSEGVALDYLAGVQINMGAYSLAQESLTNALTRLEQTNSRGWLCKIWGDLSLLAWLQSDFGAAQDCAKRAQQLAAEVGDRRQVASALTRCGRALQGLQRYPEALDVFTQAFAIYQELEQYNRSLEPLAGMALNAQAQHDDATAKQWLENMLTHLQSAQLDCTDEALYVYLACYQLLTASNDPRAPNLLQRAHSQLQSRAATLATEKERRTFWSAPSHAVVLHALQSKV